MEQKEQKSLTEILRFYGMPEDNIDMAITQIAQGYGACRYLDGERMNFERVDCPLRQECRWDGVICSPLFKTTLSAQEMKVGKLFHMGLTKDEIAGMLYLSPETVNNHIRNIYHKLGVHEKGEYIRYVNEHNIFI